MLHFENEGKDVHYAMNKTFSTQEYSFKYTKYN